jgi:hypothetical protein
MKMLLIVGVVALIVITLITIGCCWFHKPPKALLVGPSLLAVGEVGQYDSKGSEGMLRWSVTPMTEPYKVDEGVLKLTPTVPGLVSVTLLAVNGDDSDTMTVETTVTSKPEPPDPPGPEPTELTAKAKEAALRLIPLTPERKVVALQIAEVYDGLPGISFISLQEAREKTGRG